MRNDPKNIVATDWNAIAEHVSLWRELVRHPNAHPDYVRAVIESRPEVTAPVVIKFTSKAPGQPLFLAVGRLEKAELTIDIGYLHFLRRPINQLTIIHGGIMGGLLDAPAAEMLLELVRTLLKTKKAERVLVAGVKKDSPLWKALGKSVFPLWRDAAPRFTPHWTAALPATWSEYEKRTDGKHRSYLRRCEKKIGEMSGGEVRVAVYTKVPDIDVLCRDAERIAGATYHRGIGAGFSDTPELRRRLAVCASNGWMRGYVLYANGIAVAFWLGTKFGTVFHLDFTGYLPEYSKQSPGLILFLRMIEDLYKTGEISSIDFGDGDAPYKQRFGDSFSPEADAIIYAPRIGLLIYSVLRTLLAAFRRMVDRLVPERLIAAIKKNWRSRSIKKGEAQ